MDYGFYWTDKLWIQNTYPLTLQDTFEISANAVYDVNSRLQGQTSLEYGWHEVATKRPNAYGLYDMAGNVAELVETGGDIYEANYNLHAKGGDWGSPYMGLTNASYSGTIIGSDANYGLRLVRPIQ